MFTPFARMIGCRQGTTPCDIPRVRLLGSSIMHPLAAVHRESLACGVVRRIQSCKLNLLLIVILLLLYAQTLLLHIQTTEFNLFLLIVFFNVVLQATFFNVVVEFRLLG